MSPRYKLLFALIAALTLPLAVLAILKPSPSPSNAPPTFAPEQLAGPLGVEPAPWSPAPGFTWQAFRRQVTGDVGLAVGPALPFSAKNADDAALSAAALRFMEARGADMGFDGC